MPMTRAELERCEGLKLFTCEEGDHWVNNLCKTSPEFRAILEYTGG